MSKLKCQVKIVSEQVYLSIGSNIGDRLANLTQAVNLLQADPAVQIKAVSSVYETQHVGQFESS